MQRGDLDLTVVLASDPHPEDIVQMLLLKLVIWQGYLLGSVDVQYHCKNLI